MFRFIEGNAKMRELLGGKGDDLSVWPHEHMTAAFMSQTGFRIAGAGLIFNSGICRRRLAAAPSTICGHTESLNRAVAVIHAGKQPADVFVINLRRSIEMREVL